MRPLFFAAAKSRFVKGAILSTSLYVGTITESFLCGRIFSPYRVSKKRKKGFFSIGGNRKGKGEKERKERKKERRKGRKKKKKRGKGRKKKGKKKKKEEKKRKEKTRKKREKNTKKK